MSYRKCKDFLGALQLMRVKEIAAIAGVTEVTARAWRDGKTAPTLSQLVSLCAEVPECAEALMDAAGWQYAARAVRQEHLDRQQHALDLEARRIGAPARRR
jgi:hypothetical protein